jgi:flagellar biogenesis protein FliO
MRSIQWTVLVSVAVCHTAVWAEEGAVEARKVTPPVESAIPLDPSSAVTSRGSGSWLSSWRSIGLFLAGGIWVWRSRLGVETAADGELWNVISQRPLDSRHSLMVVRFADSLLLLSVSPNEVSLLKEIEDPAQVAQVNSLVSGQRQVRANSLRQRLATLGLLRGMA